MKNGKRTCCAKFYMPYHWVKPKPLKQKSIRRIKTAKTNEGKKAAANLAAYSLSKEIFDSFIKQGTPVSSCTSPVDPRSHNS